MGELEAALQEHLRKVAQAELVAHAPQDDQQYDIGWEFEIVITPPTPLPLSIGAFHPWNTSPSPIPRIRSTLSRSHVLPSPPTPNLVLPASSGSPPASNV